MTKLKASLGVLSLAIIVTACGGLDDGGQQTRRKANGTYCDWLSFDEYWADPFCSSPDPYSPDPYSPDPYNSGAPVDSPEPPAVEPPAAEPPPAPLGCFDGEFDTAAVRRKVKSCYDSGNGTRPRYLNSNYQPAPANTPPSLRHDASHVGWTLAGWAASIANWFFDTTASFRDRIESYVGCPSKPRALLDELRRKINNMPGASKAQKVCAAQCVSSRIIDYESNSMAGVFGVSYTLAHGMGKCTEFASIAKYLMNGSDGVSASLGTSPYHAFTRVTFDGNTWTLEPQRDPSHGDGSCTYYRQP